MKRKAEQPKTNAFKKRRTKNKNTKLKNGTENILTYREKINPIKRK